MTIDEKIRNEKLQCDINRGAANISALSSGKLDEWEYLWSEEILFSQQQKQLVTWSKITLQRRLD